MARVFTHVIAFRVTAAERRKLEELRATFPDRSWGEAFRWLLGEDVVRETVECRIGDGEPGPIQGGIDWSLPVGDR